MARETICPIYLTIRGQNSKETNQQIISIKLEKKLTNE